MLQAIFLSFTSLITDINFLQCPHYSYIKPLPWIILVLFSVVSPLKGKVKANNNKTQVLTIIYLTLILLSDLSTLFSCVVMRGNVNRAQNRSCVLKDVRLEMFY